MDMGQVLAIASPVASALYVVARMAYVVGQLRAELQWLRAAVARHDKELRELRRVGA